MTLKAELEQKEARLVGGRQLLRMVFDHYKISEELGTLFDINDLMAVSFKGDQKMEQFLNSWDSMLAGMKSKPTDDVIEALFLKQLRKSQVLKEEISHYDRTDRSDPTGHTSCFSLQVCKEVP